MYDNGFARAQRSYEAMEPPDNTEDWETYQERYDNEDNDKQLADNLFSHLTETGWTERETKENERALRMLLLKGIGHLDIDGKDKLYAMYDVAPSFDTFYEDRRDDGPDPDIGRDD